MTRRNVCKKIKQNLIENLESRLLMTAAFAPTDLNGTWNVAGTNVTGSLTLNGGNVTAGSETFDDGSTVAGNGTYTLDAGGAITLTTTEFTRSGTVNSTRDFIALNDTTSNNGMTYLVRHDTAFVADDASGLWNIFLDGNSGPSTGAGSVLLDGAGHITKGSVLTTKGNKAITGTYTFDAAGNLDMTLTIAGTAGTVEFIGAMNNSKDLAGLSSADLQTAAAVTGPTETAGQASRVMMMTKASGKYTKADLKGNYLVTMFGGNGTVTFDGKGKFAGTVSFSTGDATFTGTYSVSAAGQVTYSAKLVTAGPNPTTYTWQSKGTFNQNKNDIFSVQNPSLSAKLPSQNSLTVFTRSANAVPTFTKAAVQTIVTTAGKSYTLAELLAQTDAADIDLGDTVEFTLGAAQDVTLEINGNPASPGDLVHFADILTITPAPQTVGKTIKNAVQLTAFDESDSSASTITMQVKSIKAPIISIAAAPLKANESKHIASKFTISRAGGDTKSALTVNYTVGGTAANDGSVYPLLTGTVVIPAGKPNVVITLLPIDDGKQDNDGATATLTLAAVVDGTYTITPTVKRQVATISIIDVNRPPVLNNPIPLPHAQVGVQRVFGYTSFVAAIDAEDPETGTANIVYKITGLNSTLGVWTKNGVVVKGTTTVDSLDELEWTPTKAGTFKIFNIAATDGVLTSAAEAITLTIDP